MCSAPGHQPLCTGSQWRTWRSSRAESRAARSSGTGDAMPVVSGGVEGLTECREEGEDGEELHDEMRGEGGRGRLLSSRARVPRSTGDASLFPTASASRKVECAVGHHLTSVHHVNGVKHAICCVAVPVPTNRSPADYGAEHQVLRKGRGMAEAAEPAKCAENAALAWSSWSG